MNASEGIEVFTAIAVWANEKCVPQEELNLHITQVRGDVGEACGWSRDYIAVTMGMTARNVYLQRQKYKESALEEKMQEFLTDGQDPLDRILGVTRPGKPVTALGIMLTLKGFTM